MDHGGHSIIFTSDSQIHSNQHYFDLKGKYKTAEKEGNYVSAGLAFIIGKEPDYSVWLKKWYGFERAKPKLDLAGPVFNFEVGIEI